MMKVFLCLPASKFHCDWRSLILVLLMIFNLWLQNVGLPDRALHIAPQIHTGFIKHTALATITLVNNSDITAPGRMCILLRFVGWSLCKGIALEAEIPTLFTIGQVTHLPDSTKRWSKCGGQHSLLQSGSSPGGSSAVNVSLWPEGPDKSTWLDPSSEIMEYFVQTLTWYQSTNLSISISKLASSYLIFSIRAVSCIHHPQRLLGKACLRSHQMGFVLGIPSLNW